MIDDNGNRAYSTCGQPRLWSALTASASVLAMILSASAATAQATAAAQAAPAAAAAEKVAEDPSDIVVSASRITAAGFDAPTPTTVFGADLILKAAQPNIFVALAQIPSLQGSTGTTVANGNTSTGATGLSGLNLRGLGTFRTLVLLDGQRIVPSNISNIVDVSLLPQLLVERVDVVTGGASASFGSDAVAGVVNFVTNKRFEGFKANVQGGITTYGDDANGTVQAAYGRAFLDSKLHVTVAGEYFYNQGIVPGGLPGGLPINGRRNDFQTSSVSRSIAGTPAGQPQIVRLTDNAQSILRAQNGLIVSGPLQGTGFGVGGVPFEFQYGGSGIPDRNAAGTVAGCLLNVCDASLRGTVRGPQSSAGGANAIDGQVERIVGYGRASYDLTDRLEIFGTINIADVRTNTQPVSGTPTTNTTAQCDVAFLDPSILQRCQAAGITSFQFGTWGENLNRYLDVVNVRKQQRYVIGTDGSFDLFGSPLKFNAYYQLGRGSTAVNVRNNVLVPLFNAARDAVRLTPGGPIVCRSAVARAAGCLPYNVFGDVSNPIEAFRWFAPESGSKSYSSQEQDAASLVFNGTAFKNWAGDVSVAFGAEWRRESYRVTGDPYGAGIANSPFNAEFPANPVISTAGLNWFAGNFANGSGGYNVKDFFIEAGIPLLNSAALGKLDLNAAFRGIEYSTSGWVTTWKVGATWDTPLDGLRLRAVRSRDIRAPNLSDLFAAPVTLNGSVNNRFVTPNSNVQLQERNLGNPLLTPEIGSNLGLGGVYSPAFIPGLTFSFDYFEIKLRDAVQNLGNQQIVDLCFDGNQAFCGPDNFVLTGVVGSNTPPYVNRRPFNVASLETSGFDIEASYRFSLDSIGVPGNFTLRGLATHTLDFTVDPGVPGTAPQQFAGNNSTINPAPGTNGVARWKAYVQQTWGVGKFQFTATERIVGAGAINPDNIVCTAGSCPLPTVRNGTTNFNSIPGQVFIDLGVIFNVSDPIAIYANVDNVSNQLIPAFGSPSLYDPIGRRFRGGVRVSF